LSSATAGTGFPAYRLVTLSKITRAIATLLSAGDYKGDRARP
jgi:hypothetical protein